MATATLIVLIKYLIAGIGIGLGIYYARFTVPFFNWIKGGIENQDGKLENKDLQIVFISLLTGFITITIYLGASYPDALIYSAFATLAGLFGIKEFYGKKNGNS